MVLDLYHRILRKLAHIQVEHPFLTIAVIIALTIIMFGGAAQMRTNTALEQMMPASTEEIKAFDDLRNVGLGQDAIAVVLEISDQNTIPDQVLDLREERMFQYYEQLSAVLAENHDVLAVRGPHTAIAPSSPEEIPQSPQLQSALLGYMNPQASRAALLILTDISADDTRMSGLADEIRRDLEAIPPPPGVTASLTGTPIIQQRLGQLVAADRKNTQWIATILVFLITALIFMSFSSALVPILVVLFSVNWLYGTMGYTGLPISTLAGGVAAMVIGIGIDFAIHILNKFRYERKRGFTIKESIECAVVETGTALTATALTTIAAFLAFLVGAMPEMNRFGILMAMGIGYALIFSLIGLPALLVIEEKILYWIRDRFRFGLEHEMHLEGGENNA